MKKAFIHISDLHVTAAVNEKGEKSKKVENVWLNTDNNDQINSCYINTFCNFIKENYKDREFYLLITGDITNQSDEIEYDFAQKYISDILTQLGISANNLLIVPGDHDVNRYECRKAFMEGREINPSKKPCNYNEEKYCYFSSFYEKIKSKKFDYDKSIVDILDFEVEKILLVGINSNYNIDYDGGDGAVNINCLKKGLQDINKKYEEYSKIAVFHHNLYASYENSSTGQWDKDNLVEFMGVLNSFEFKCLFYGNEHTRNSKSDNQIYRSDCGSFAQKSPAPSFKIYDIEHTEHKTFLPLHLIVLQNANKNTDHKFGSWGELNNQHMGEIGEIILKELPSLKNKPKEDNILDTLNTFELNETKAQPTEVSTISSYSNPEIKAELLKRVKNEQLYHSGHFHWSETSRAHNWIDASTLLSKVDNLEYSQSAILDIIEHEKIEYDFIIGLGIEGNLLSTDLLFRSNKPYSFLPYSYRYDGHNLYEKRLNYSNDGSYKTVLIITDVVNEGRTLRKLINKREKDFFAKVENIIVVSLFYAGDDTSNSINILNRIENNSFDKENDHIEGRIKYHYVLDLQVEKCPNSNNFRNECVIYKEKLCTVYCFYDEAKALSKKEKGG